MRRAFGWSFVALVVFALAAGTAAYALAARRWWRTPDLASAER